MAVLGGAAFARCSADEAADGLALALDSGVTALDVAPSYGGAEAVLGPLLPPVRDTLFLSCKTHRRSADGARAQLEASLTILGTDHFDVYQAHGVTDHDVLAERAPALDVIVAARDEGLTRFAGITGHNVSAPAAFLAALDRWDLDTVMFPVQPRLWADPDYRRDAEALLERCAERDLGVYAIKAAAARPWGDTGEGRWATTWYEPHDGADDVARGIRFALSTPGLTAFCTPGDLGVLPLALAAANDDLAMSEDERATLVADQAEERLIFPIPIG